MTGVANENEFSIVISTILSGKLKLNIVQSTEKQKDTTTFL